MNETEAIPESERITRHRLLRLLDGGFDAAAAEELSETVYVDTNEAILLLKKGCSPALAVEILR